MTITGNLPSLNPGALRSVVYIKNSTGDGVAVGTNSGVFAASGTSGFSNWMTLGSGLPNAQVFDLDYVATDDLLVAGTLGRGSFKLAQPSFVEMQQPDGLAQLLAFLGTLQAILAALGALGGGS
jgi:hypothetical protein